MEARRFGSTALAVAVLGTVIGAGAAATAGDDQAWREALEARSIALNREYGLADRPRRVLDAPGAGWLEALRARSAAMNRAYSLGRYAGRGAQGTETPDWLAALHARSEGLNRHYGLGVHVRTSAGGGRARAVAIIARPLTPGTYATTGKTFDPAGVPATAATRSQLRRRTP
jgi:hypothetical protein